MPLGITILMHILLIKKLANGIKILALKAFLLKVSKALVLLQAL
jgi:hypothetical protein